MYCIKMLSIVQQIDRSSSEDVDDNVLPPIVPLTSEMRSSSVVRFNRCDSKLP